MERRTWVNRYRDELKGLAILWVVFFHGKVLLPGAWDLLRTLGYGGVDIFLFLMGLGLYQSLSKGEELRGYAARRLWRVLPAYLPLLIVWMAVMYPGYGLSPAQALRGVAGNLAMVGYWIQTPKVFNWYANAQFLFYLIAPILFAALTRSRKPARMLFCLLGLFAMVGAANIGQPQMMGASRFPIFLLGMAFGMDWRVSDRRGWVRAGYAVAFAVGLSSLLYFTYVKPGLLIDFGMYWYPFALMTPGLCVGLSALFHRVERATRWFAPLRRVGQSSFEIYLINIWLVELAKKYQLEGVWPWLGLFAVNLALGLLYHTLVTRAVAAWRSRHPAPNKVV